MKRTEMISRIVDCLRDNSHCVVANDLQLIVVAEDILDTVEKDLSNYQIEPKLAKSKSEYRRLKIQGVDVKEPKK